jgi:sulfotransferase family protein
MIKNSEQMHDVGGRSGANLEPVGRLLIERPHIAIVSHQRNGTHFLMASLASHPLIHGRGEFVYQLQRLADVPNNQRDWRDLRFIFRNKPNRMNVAIVQYSQIRLFEALCGELSDIKVIHLLRRPLDTAYSVAQMEADRARLGNRFKAHYRLNETPPPAAQASMARVMELAKALEEVQERFIVRLAKHPHMLRLEYEDLTQGRQVNRLSPRHCREILEFLEAPVQSLSNNLRKRSQVSHMTKQG